MLRFWPVFGRKRKEEKGRVFCTRAQKSGQIGQLHCQGSKAIALCFETGSHHVFLAGPDLSVDQAALELTEIHLPPNS